MRSVLPSTSACCYASIHTGVLPQKHGILSNENRFRVSLPDIFSEVAKAGGKTGAVTHSYCRSSSTASRSISSATSNMTSPADRSIMAASTR